MWTVESPAFLFLLGLVPLGIYLRHIRPKRGGRIRFSFSLWKGERFSPPQRLLPVALLFSSFCFWTGCVLLIVSLTGPAIAIREKVYLTRGMDIMIVLDESPSMSAQDFLPGNRFESAKEVIKQFIAGRENDAIGLVSFSREAAVRVPPTIDHGALGKGLEELKIMSLGDGTAIGMGLAIAALHLEHSSAVGKVIVLLTDGENNAGEILPESAAEIASQLGIKIYVIGIGSQGEVPIEYTDPETGTVKKGMFQSRFDETLLRGIAEEAGGRYFSAKSPGALNAVFRTIDSVESIEKRVKTRIRSNPQHRILILIAFSCILFDFLLRRGFLREIL